MQECVKRIDDAAARQDEEFANAANLPRNRKKLQRSQRVLQPLATHGDALYSVRIDGLGHYPPQRIITNGRS